MLFLRLLFIALLLPVSGQNSPLKPNRSPDYQLVWSDEFNKDGRPNPENWIFEEGFMRNNELQWYQEKNAWCEDGNLVIEARREIVPNPSYDWRAKSWKKTRKQARYTSASLTTSGKQEWTFGRMEIRAKFNAKKGLWPALWTTGNGRWPHCGEIDIMEYYDHSILANACHAGEGGKTTWFTGKHPMAKFEPETWDEKFHYWVMEWTREKIEIFLNGKLLNSIDLNETVNKHGPPMNPFHAPQFFRVNMAIGGDKGGNPSETEFPQRYLIDYVRVYQKKDS